MDDVSGLADTSQKFASFATVARKFKYKCVYTVHAIHPEKSIWKSILSQTNIFNIFPASVPLLSVTKILQAKCIRKTLKYLPVNSLWINKLFIKLANESENVCLIIDCSGFNPKGPSRFRTNGDNPVSQTCYLNVSDDNQMFNVFLCTRIKSQEATEKILFQIDGIKSRTNNETFNTK